MQICKYGWTVIVVQIYIIFTVASKKNKHTALTNPADIERHRQFRKMVDDLEKYSYIRHYTSDIQKRTGESSGNIANYYNGKKPIGDNFITRFEEEYAEDLKLARKKIKGPDRPIASNKPT